jgi:potassium-dependent mechanosensitive channel
MHRVIRIGLCIASCWVLSGTAAAQQSSQATPKPNPPSPQATPIPLSEIAAQGESASDALRNIEDGLSTDQVTTTIEKRLPQLVNEIELRIAEMNKLLAASLPLEFLHFLEIALQTFRNELSNWNRDLTDHVKTLGDQIAQLDKLREVWKETIQSPEVSRTAPEILKRAQDLIDTIGRIQHAVESLREKDLTLQGGVLEAAARLQKASSALEQARANAIRNLFVPDSPSIWELWVKNWTEENRGSLMRRAGANVFIAYVKQHPTAFLLHAIIILSLYLVILWLRRGVDTWTKEEPRLLRAAPVFDTPISTAITLSFLITGPLYTLAPFLLRAIFGGAVLIPTALILRRLIERTLFPIISALLIFFFVDQLRLITAPVPLWSRSVFGLEMLGGTLFLIWLIRGKHSHVGANVTRRFALAIRLATRVGLVVFPLTLLANIFGYVNFANLLGNGTLRSAYIAAALYAALRIVEGLIIIALKARPLGLTRVVRLHRPILQRRICGFAEFLAFVYWLSFALDFFLLRTPLITGTERVLHANLTIGSLSLSLGQILVFGSAVWASFVVSRFLRFVLDEDVYYRWRLSQGIPQAISTVVHYAILLIGFFVALAALGVDLTKVTILAGAFTVGVGFGLQTVINNFVCGLILLFERPIKVGDVVQIDSDIGEVRRIGIRACVIRTTDGSEVIVPNGSIISNKVTSWTFSDRYRAVEVLVSAARGVAPQRVVELLKSVAANHPSVAKEPAPQAYVVNFAPGSVNLQLRAWTDRYEDWVQVRSDLSIAVDDALTRENINVA